MRWPRESRQDRLERSTYERAYKRLNRQPTHVVLDWCDQVGSSLALAVNSYRRDADVGALDEAADSVLCLEAALQIVRERARAAS